MPGASTTYPGEPASSEASTGSVSPSSKCSPNQQSDLEPPAPGQESRRSASGDQSLLALSATTRLLGRYGAVSIGEEAPIV